MEKGEHIFLSYRSIEKDFALKLARDLKLAGFRVWMDRMEGIRPGDDWRDAIQAAIDGCAAMITALSPDYVTSEYCQKEMKRANTLGHPIFPVLLQPMEPAELPLVLEGIQYVDFTDEAHYQVGFDALAKRLTEKIPQAKGVQLDEEKRYLIELIATLEKGRGVQEYIELHGKADAVRPQPLAIDELGYYKLLDPSTKNTSIDEQPQDVPLESIRIAQEMHPRFVLLGAPGSGKTTTLRRLARLDAQLHLESPRTVPIPIWLTLAAWQGESDDPFEFVATKWNLGGDLRQLLADGDVMLYLDGLNEMGEGSSSKIARLKEWLHSSSGPKRVFISCRIEDYHDELQLPQVVVEPLSEQQVRRFAEKYLEEHTDGFLNRLYADGGDKSLARLARNPYLLGALIYLYQESEIRDLPRNSGDLSARLVAALWDRERQRRTPGWVPFEKMQTTLSRLAFEMIDKDMPTLVPKQYVLQRLASRRWFGGRGKAQSLFDAFKRANLIESRGGLVGFYHQLLQEYFAAARLLDMDLTDYIPPLEAVGESGFRVAKKWDQVVIAACGCDKQKADEVLSTTASLDPILALACVESGAVFSESALQDVRQAVANAVTDITNWRRRKLGVEAAARLNDLELLLAGARDFDHNVRYTALNFLIGRTEQRVVDAFIESLTFRDAGVCGLAASALRGTARADITVAQHLLDDERSEVRKIAIRGLSENEEASETLQAHFSNESEADLRKAIIENLAKDETSIPFLLDALSDEQASVRQSAIDGLLPHADTPDTRSRLRVHLEIETDVAILTKLDDLFLTDVIQAAIDGETKFDELFLRYQPKRRARVGRKLAEVGDTRPGVGLRPDGLPDIAWSEPIPLGKYPIGGDEVAWKPLEAETYELDYSYRVAKYPVTNAQFQAFIDADEAGYNNPAYWTRAGLQWKGERRAPNEHGDPNFRLANHPRIYVRWYEAMAFCAWLTERYQEAGLIQADEIIRLPQEKEWEIAARGEEGLFYPYGNEFDAGRGNTSETGISQTSAVGMFPNGVSWCGAHDLSGNVWEWCLNPYAEPDGGLSEENIQSDARRVLRGGSWNYYNNNARAASRGYGDPREWSAFGFRWLCCPRLLSK